VRISHKALLSVVAVLAVAAIVGMVLLRPTGLEVEEIDTTQMSRLVDGVLVAVEEVPGSGDDGFGLIPGAILVDVTARIEATGELAEFTMLDDTGDTFAAGQRVRLQEIEQADGSRTYLVSDFRRERPLLLLFVMFAFAVVAFSRMQGLRALLGLALTFVVILTFIVPAILGGRDPVAVALVGAVAIMIITLYLSHGFSRKTTAAVVGTAAALALTGVLAVVFVAAAQLTGFTSEEARLANVEVGGLSLTGLLLAGIIIGGLGVLDDVTMSQSSTVFELHRANPAAGFGDLLRGGLSVGRDHIAATVNTLFLAYAGASLPLLILFVTGIDPFGTVITSEIVAVEIVRTLVGSIGLIAAVPLTTALAAGIVLGDPAAAEREALLGGGHSHGHGAGVALPREKQHDEPQRRGSWSSQPAEATDHPRVGGRGSVGTGDDEEDDWVDRLRDAYRRDDRRDGGAD
jgi:uncharacterized membrane protein